MAVNTFVRNHACSLRVEGVANEKDCIDWGVVVDCCKSGGRNYIRNDLPGTKWRKGLWFIVFKVAERRMLLRRHMHGCRIEMGGVEARCRIITS